MVGVGENHPVSGPLSPVEQASWASKAFPLGVCWSGDDVTFAVYSGSATRILLEIYEQALGADAKYDYWMEKGPTTGVWQAKLAKVPPGTLYAFRCFGPNWDFTPSWRRGNSSQGFVADVNDHGERFNPNKVLFDPYARELSHDLSAPAVKEALEASNLNNEIFATGGGLVTGTARREYDTGRFCTKGLIIRDETSTGKRPRIPVEKTLIYETHVRGLTQHPSASRLASLVGRYPGFDKVQDIPEKLRGTYAGVARMAEYLKALGFTTIELLPIHESDNDGNTTDQPGGNYWGYMTQGFFAPDRRYSSDKSPGGPTREFKEMVRAFHDAGLEVYLDVVYNHSSEGGNWNNDQGMTDRDTVGFSFLGGFDTAYYAQNEGFFLIQGGDGLRQPTGILEPRRPAARPRLTPVLDQGDGHRRVPVRSRGRPRPGEKQFRQGSSPAAGHPEPRREERGGGHRRALGQLERREREFSGGLGRVEQRLPRPRPVLPQG
jgi:glycogen operon protein